MQDYEEFLQKVKDGDHERCSGCPRNPKIDKRCVFSISCSEHFAKNDNVFVLAIGLDPSGRGSGAATETKRLCFICNKDQSAKNVKEFFKELDIPTEKWYASNIVMHGIEGDNSKTNFNLIKNKCIKILLTQIEFLKPKLIIGFGKEVGDTLYQQYKLDINKDWINWVKSDPIKIKDGLYIKIIPHPGQLGTNNIGGKEEQKKIWNNLGVWIKSNIDFDTKKNYNQVQPSSKNHGSESLSYLTNPRYPL